MKIRVLRIVPDTIVDGPGLRTSIYCSGCAHHCPSCHNPQTWDFSAGTLMSVSEIRDAIAAESPDSDITFTGGDPLYQAEAFAELAKLIKTNSPQKNIWCYTGFLFEEILVDEKMNKLLPWLDVLVDGPFVLALRDTKNLRFRGSSNQRLVDVPASLRTGTVVEWKSSYGDLPTMK